MQTKNKMKKFFLRFGLWYSLNQLRQAPEILYWLRSGCNGIAPHSIKMRVIESYVRKFLINTFIESGTYLGDTLGYIARNGVQCISIELSRELYEAACLRFKTCKNIRLVYGDSGQKLPELLNEISKPVLFWLDGHYSYGITACSETHTPVSNELKAILNHPIKRHVVLIDDARCFDGKNNYPHLYDLLRIIWEDGNYTAEVSMDIIRLIPRIV